jgi:hypothetical protein
MKEAQHAIILLICFAFGLAFFISGALHFQHLGDKKMKEHERVADVLFAYTLISFLWGFLASGNKRKRI